MRSEILYLLDRRYTTVVAVLVVVALASGYVAATTHGETRTVTEERVLSTWSTSTDFEHTATVQRESEVFGRGVTLENRTVYFTELSPELDGTYEVRHGGDAAGPAEVRAQLTVVIRSVTEAEGETTEIWSETRPLASANTTSLEPGEPLRVNFSVNVTRLFDRGSEVNRNLSVGEGSTQVFVAADTVIRGGTPDEGFVDRRTDRLRLRPGSGIYVVSEETQGDRRFDATETVSREVPVSSFETQAAAVLAVLAGIAAVGLVLARRQGTIEIPEAERERIEFDRDRDRLDDWISRGEVADGATDSRDRVRVPSLEDVVDVAIDSDRRVLETDDGRYVVIVDDVEYVYERGGTDAPTGDGDEMRG